MATMSYIQTVEVYMPKSTNKFLTMKQAPPRIKFDPWEPFVKMQYDADLKMTVIWDANGTIRIQYDTGVREIYHAKPTVADVLKRPNAGEYLRIHKDGSVEHGYNGEYYYWGPEEEVEWNMKNIQTCMLTDCSCDGCAYASECLSDYDDDYDDYERDKCDYYGCYCNYGRY